MCFRRISSLTAVVLTVLQQLFITLSLGSRLPGPNPRVSVLPKGVSPHGVFLTGWSHFTSLISKLEKQSRYVSLDRASEEAKKGAGGNGKTRWKGLHHSNITHRCSLTPNYLSSKFIPRSDVTSYNLRDSKKKLAIPLPRTNYYKNSFGYSGAVLWNSLP